MSHAPKRSGTYCYSAYKQLEADSTLYEQWFEVLGKHGVTTAVLGKVRQSFSGAEGSDILSSGEASGMAVLGKKRPLSRGNYVLEKHISAIVEFLADNSSRWYEIGISLGLSKNFLDELYSRYLALGGKVCLFQVLAEWVGGHAHAKRPTVENLKKALGSQLVGLGDVAAKMDGEWLRRLKIFRSDTISEEVTSGGPTS